MGPVYDGDAVKTDGQRSERTFPTTSSIKTFIQMDIGTYNTTLSGYTLPMDLQLHPCPLHVYRHPGVGTQGEHDEGDSTPAGNGGRGDGRQQKIPA